MGFQISKICRFCGGEIERRPGKGRFGQRQPGIEWRCKNKKCDKSKQWNVAGGDK
jgi:ribosomal protein L24E